MRPSTRHMFRIPCSRITLLAQWLSSGSRSFHGQCYCSLRTGLLSVHFRRLDGRPSTTCIFCDKHLVRNPTKHVISLCPAWQQYRSSVQDAFDWGDASCDVFTLRVLGCTPSQEHFRWILEWSSALDKKASSYWAGKGHATGA